MSARFASRGIEELVGLLGGRRTVVLSGAGCSTPSGIPDYRGTGRPRRAGSPVLYRTFVDEPEARRRYWARSFSGWPRFRSARPNAAHRAIAELEQRGSVAGVITQNVDGLHHGAGSRRVIPLHGSLHQVRCLGCGELSSRDDLQLRLAELNPDWSDEVSRLEPDGDAELAGTTGAFRTADCLDCGGVLKPAVVFFGENVPRPVVDAAWRLFDEARALLVVGSSLAVFSGHRFVRRAAARDLPVGLVNLGPSRGDAFATVRVHADVATALPELARTLNERGPRRAGPAPAGRRGPDASPTEPARTPTPEEAGAR